MSLYVPSGFPLSSRRSRHARFLFFVFAYPSLRSSSGKTKDSNSNFFAKFCFNLGIDLKRIEVIADDEEEIVEAARRMTKNYDFVITCKRLSTVYRARFVRGDISCRLTFLFFFLPYLRRTAGGIGPTPDDITCASPPVPSHVSK